ncbi:MAG: rhodanese-like domain-containing protein [Acidimicrobiales bacterium]
MATDVHPEQLRARMASGEVLFVLDVREVDEVAEWAFPGALNVPLSELGNRTGELPEDRPIVVVCHAGVRSAAAADALCRAGWPAENLAGGVVTWRSTEGE